MVQEQTTIRRKGQTYSERKKQHLQPYLTSNFNDLPEKQRKRLENSWAGVFYWEFFRRLKEEPFSVLYTDIPSRPNIPVNVLVGLEYLKAGFGWSDEELYDTFIYNMQVRLALGYPQLGEGDFELRTLNNFRQRLSRHMQDMGATIPVIDDSGDDIPADYVVEIQSGLNSIERGSLLLPVLQLLPYYRSMEKGLNPDRPKNLDAVVVL